MAAAQAADRKRPMVMLSAEKGAAFFCYWNPTVLTVGGCQKEFTFVAPTCRQDFLDEATMQSNCLAGYVNKFMNGGCLIIFMRKKNSPDRSYITVEIVDGQVNQAKYARNKNLSEYDARILMEWVEKCRLRNAAQAV